MKPRRDAETVTAAPEPEPEDILVRYARLGMERGRGRGRYVAGSFAGVSGLGDVRQQHQTALMLAHQASLAAMAASGGLRIESGGTVTDTRFEQYREQEFAKQFLERAARQQFQKGIIP